MEPQPVKIVDTEKAIPVEVIQTGELPKMGVKLDGSQTLEPTTTEQEDIITAGQRKINLIWESTQSKIAIMVCACTMVVGILNVVAEVFFGKPPSQIPTIFAVAFGTVIGFYFARTNHQAIGGIGKKVNENQVYKGR